MAEIYSVYEVFPDGGDADFCAIADKLQSYVPEGVKVQKAEVLDHVFGLKKIRVEMIVNADDEMIGSKLEDALTGIEGVGNIECVSSTNL